MLILAVTGSWLLLSCVTGLAFGALFRGARAPQDAAVASRSARVPVGLRPRVSPEDDVAVLAGERV